MLTLKKQRCFLVTSTSSKNQSCSDHCDISPIVWCIKYATNQRTKSAGQKTEDIPSVDKRSAVLTHPLHHIHQLQEVDQDEEERGRLHRFLKESTKKRVCHSEDGKYDGLQVIKFFLGLKFYENFMVFYEDFKKGGRSEQFLLCVVFCSFLR